MLLFFFLILSYLYLGRKIYPSERKEGLTWYHDNGSESWISRKLFECHDSYGPITELSLLNHCLEKAQRFKSSKPKMTESKTILH